MENLIIKFCANRWLYINGEMRRKQANGNGQMKAASEGSRELGIRKKIIQACTSSRL